MTKQAQEEKEKGNAAFKAGAYDIAIGHYTAAFLANRGDVTYPLNRAAAYLKLGKYDDAERDCTTVLNLSSKNVKAFFRRGQARAGQGHFIEAQRDFTEVLRLEPDNQATKEELKRIAELIEAEKRKKSAHRPVSSTFDATPSPKRRRVPITIVGPGETFSNEPAQQVEGPKRFAASTSEEIAVSSSRSLKSSPISTTPESKSQSTTSQIPTSASAFINPSISTSSTPTTTLANVQKASSFAEAKQVRESAKTSKVGGGIFRASGQSTLFPSRTGTKSPGPSPRVESGATQSPPPNQFTSHESHDSEVRTEDGLEAMPPHLTFGSEPATTLPNGSVKSSEIGKSLTGAPASLSDLVTAWRSLLTCTERWHLLQTIPPSSMPAFCKTSLEPPLLALILEVFLVMLSSLPSTEDMSIIREYMYNLAKVERFSTLILFMNAKEKAVAKEVWRKLGVQGSPPGAWSPLGSL